MKIFQAKLEHIEEIANLFDRYRIFYQSPSNIEAARNFLQERLQQNESVIFAASCDGIIIGFTQLYASFSSVSMKRIWILNDLFVEESYRKQGIANYLMNEAEKFARETGAARIVLSTQISNTVAQKLYESRGYLKDRDFYHYALHF
jgi:ribosomal protein S18 acetylase RimI-like enzyme